MGGTYRAFMKLTCWYGRLVTRAAVGFMAAMASECSCLCRMAVVIRRV